jgi:putative two-component system response regulator
MNHEFASLDSFGSLIVKRVDGRDTLLQDPVAQLHARVLIVDDEPANVLLLEEFLSDTATEVRGLTDSRQVEQVFKEFEPDIVLLDLHMPAVDGQEVLRRLSSARESLGYLPVIVLTGDTGRVARNSALLLGANDFLLKPLDRTEVVLRVRNLLHTRELFVDLAAATRLLQRDQTSG